MTFPIPPSSVVCAAALPLGNAIPAEGIALLLMAASVALGFFGGWLWAQRKRSSSCYKQQLKTDRTRDLEKKVRGAAEAERQAKVFALLGQKLSLANTQKEAAEIIVTIADDLLGWDSCGLHAYSQEDHSRVLLLNYDVIDGVRQAVPLDTPPAVSEVMRRTVEEGPQLILREAAAFAGLGTSPFGDQGRPSASLMYAPIRNGQRVVGVLSIHSYTVNAYDKDDLAVLQALADYCAGALERIRAAEALRESQKLVLHQERLAAVGGLASGAAHEFNNILTVVQGHCDLLLSCGVLPPEQRESLLEISAGARRATDLTRQLLSFSRKQAMQTQVLDLNRIVSELTSILSRVLGEHIECTCDFYENLPPIAADPAMMEQVLLNLLVNARDAMPSGGHVRITTGEATITRHHNHPESRPGNFVTLRVADTGCGMDATTLSQIFEPFFTTKDVGKGTGLGLSSVYGIMKQHAGWVEASSVADVGTEFLLYFPVSTAPIDSQPATSTVSPGLAEDGGGGTILVVEDETALRQMICIFLRAKNYQVIDAPDGVVGLQKWAEGADEIDLIFTDMVLPHGVSGKDIVARVRRDHPDTPVILTSGFNVDLVGADLNLDDLVTFLPKPYSLETLAGMIRERIERREACFGDS